MDIRELATIENAKEYELDSEKFVFCIDLMGISAHASDSEISVNELEDMFEEILKNNLL
jgi:hypothetical protein